jgi:antitoxin component YwqK of YwqJK toxin-antitoxin module
MSIACFGKKVNFSVLEKHAILDSREYVEITDLYDEGFPYTGTVISGGGSNSNTMECNYKDGKLHGLYRMTSYYGNILSEHIYENGVLVQGFIISYQDPDSKAATTDAIPNDKKITLELPGQSIVVSGNGSLGYTNMYSKKDNLCIIKSYYNSGNLKEETKFHIDENIYSLDDITDPYEHTGTRKVYYENGNIKTDETFDKQHLTTIYKRYYENGNLAKERIYDPELKHFFLKLYAEDGTIIEESTYKYVQMPKKWRHSENEPILDGVYKKYVAGKNFPIINAIYENDKEIESVYYFDNGRIWKESKKDMDENTEYKEYYVDGALKESHIFNKANFSEERKFYFRNGNIDREIYYVNEKINRQIFRYYSGAVFEDISYSFSDDSCVIKIFYENGALLKEVKSKNRRPRSSSPYFETYDDGDPVDDIIKYYHDNGNLYVIKDRNSDSHWKKYAKDGITEIDAQIYEYSNEDPNHLKEYYLNSQLQFERYEDREPNVEKHYRENGVPATDFETDYIKKNNSGYSDRIEVGYYKAYHSNGQLGMETTYNKKGQKNGIHREFYINGVLEKESLYKNGKLIRVIKESYENGQLKSEYNSNTDIDIVYDEDGGIREKIDNAAKTQYNNMSFSEKYNYWSGSTKTIVIGIVIVLSIAIIIILWKYFSKALSLEPEKRYLDYFVIFINIICVIYLRQTFYDRMNGNSPDYSIAVAFGLFFVLLLYWSNDSTYKTKYFLYFIFLELVIEFFLAMIVSSSKTSYSRGRDIDYDKLKNIKIIFGVTRAFLSSFLYQCFKKASYIANKPTDTSDKHDENEINPDI